MCLMLSVKLFWCSSIPYIYGQLERVYLPSVYVHSAIYYTYLVWWYFVDAWSFGVGALVYVHSAVCETSFG